MIPYFLCVRGEKMEFGADTWWLLGIVVAGVTSVIGYFLKRTMSRQDEHEKDINYIKQTYVSKEELKEFKDTVNKGLDKLQKDVDDIKSNSLTRKEFMQSQNKLEDKISKIHDILMARRERNS